MGAAIAYGLLGMAALGQVEAPGDAFEAHAYDISNAFTFVSPRLAYRTVNELSRRGRVFLPSES